MDLWPGTLDKDKNPPKESRAGIVFEPIIF
jgi:hypothetical protein